MVPIPHDRLQSALLSLRISTNSHQGKVENHGREREREREKVVWGKFEYKKSGREGELTFTLGREADAAERSNILRRMCL